MLNKYFLIIIVLSLSVSCSSNKSKLLVEWTENIRLSEYETAFMGTYVLKVKKTESGPDTDVWFLDSTESIVISNQLKNNDIFKAIIPFSETINVLNTSDKHNVSHTLLDALTERGFERSILQFSGYGKQICGVIPSNTATKNIMGQISQLLGAETYAFVLYAPVLSTFRQHSAYSTYTTYSMKMTGSLIITDNSGKILLRHSIIEPGVKTNVGNIFAENRDETMYGLKKYNLKPILYKSINIELLKSFSMNGNQKQQASKYSLPMVVPMKSGNQIYIYWGPATKSPKRYKLDLFDENGSIIKTYNRRDGYFKLGNIWEEFSTKGDSFKFQLLDVKGYSSEKFTLQKHTWD